MPYIETLTSGAVANTPAAIFEAMCDINNCNGYQYKVSVVYHSRNGKVLCIGDSLDVANGKKKRWWEKKKKPTGQLRLPFTMYEPAQVISADYDGSNGMMRIKIKRRSDLSRASYTVILTYGGNSRGNVLAIKIHKVMRKLVEEGDQSQPPFCLDLDWDSANLRDSIVPSPTQPATSVLISLLNDAILNGIAITPTGVVYDAQTGRRLGDDGVLRTNPDGLTAVQLRGPDGDTYGLNLRQDIVHHIDERGPSALECVELLEAAARVGMVVTTTGDVYNRVTGGLVGSAIQVETTAEYRVPVDSGSPWLPRSVRGELRMLNNEVRNFQVGEDSLTYVGSETFERVESPRSRNEFFTQMYDGQAPDLRQDLGDMRTNIQGTAARVNRQVEDRCHRVTSSNIRTPSERMRAAGRRGFTSDLDLNESSWLPRTDGGGE